MWHVMAYIYIEAYLETQDSLITVCHLSSEDT